MPKVYVSVGHGKQDSGRFDPGAVAPDGSTEYDGNRALAAEVTKLLRSYPGYVVTSEAEAAHGQDPDYKGSVAVVNRGGFDFALDCHMDWAGGSADHVWPLVAPGASVSGRVATAMVDAAKAAGVTNRGPTPRTDLYWLNGTNCPAVLVESGRVGSARPVAKVAEVLCRGIAAVFGGAPTAGGPPPPVPPSANDGVIPPTASPGAPPGTLARHGRGECCGTRRALRLCRGPMSGRGKAA